MSHNTKAVTTEAKGQQLTAEQRAATRPAMIRTSGDGALTAEIKAALVSGLRSGQSLSSLLRDHPHWPGATTISRERLRDAQFDAELVQARADGIAANIDEALDYQYAVRTDKHLSIAASKYTAAVAQTAQLLAPKHYGPMLKIAGADGEKLSIALVAYSGGQQQLKAIDVEAETAKLPGTDSTTDNGQ